MSVYKIPVTKSKGFVEIETDQLPDEVMHAVTFEGLKALVNKNMSKVTAAEYPDEANRRSIAQEIAEANVADLIAGKIKKPRASAPKGVSGPVMTEARRLAKALVKDALKAAGEKVSHYPASEITRLANLVIEEHPELIEQAKANLEVRTAKPIALDIASQAQADPELVEKAEAKKAKAKADKPGISAAQAGRVAPRKKPAQQATVQ